MNATPMLGALACCLAAGSPPVPDSWMPFRNQRVVSDSGGHYVVVRHAGRNAIAFEYCARADGAGRIAAESYPYIEKEPKVSIDRDPGDRLIAEGNVPQLPYKVLVPDGLDGFLLFDKYYSVGYGKVITWVDGEGDVVIDLDLADLFGGPPPAARATVSSLWWNQHVWVDSEAQRIVVIAAGDLLREVAIPSGEVSTPDLARCLEWIDRGPEAGRAAALELVVRMGEAAADRAAPRALELFHDEGEPVALRMRAAVLLAAAGTAVDAESMFARTGQDENLPVEVRRYAFENLSAAIGDDAFPILRDQMRGKASDVWWSAVQGFVAAGDGAVPVLLDMLAEEGESPDYRGGAAHALKAIGGEAAVPGLVAAVEAESDYVADAAFNALYANRTDRARQAMIAMLEEGSDRERRIGGYLAEHPCREAIPVLEKALAEVPDAAAAEALKKALEACRESSPAADPDDRGRAALAGSKSSSTCPQTRLRRFRAGRLARPRSSESSRRSLFATGSSKPAAPWPAARSFAEGISATLLRTPQ